MLIRTRLNGKNCLQNGHDLKTDMIKCKITVFLVSHTGIHNTNHVKNYLIEKGKIKNVESFEEISEG